MNESIKQNILLACAALGAVALVGMFANQLVYKAPAAPMAVQQSSQPNVVVQPLVVLPSSSESSKSFDGLSEGEVLGGRIHNIQESFDEGIAVDGTEVISGTGYVAASNGMTISGNVTTTSLVTDKVQTFTSSASSQSLCSIQNTTGSDRVLGVPTIVYATSSVTGGTYRFTISQSATANATGTGANLYFDAGFSVPTDGLNNLTTTSTLTSTGSIWRSGNYVNFLVASPTSTFSGNCRLPSY